MIRRLILFALLACTTGLCATEPILWSDGKVDVSGAPQGKLLSDNAGYWGDAVLTGVTYSYVTAPDNPADCAGSDKNTFGRRLLDGAVQGNWHIPVGSSRQPLTVTFDFKRPCEFTEVSVFASRTPVHRIKLELSADQERWNEVLDGDGKDGFSRIRLSGENHGRYLRMTFQSTDNSLTYLDEVLVWGDAVTSDEFPEAIRPVSVPELGKDAFQSLRGVKETTFGLKGFETYRKKLGPAAKSPVIWGLSAQSTPSAPVLPMPGAQLEMLMSRSETESVYLTLTNPSPVNTSLIEVEAFELAGFEMEIRVGGVLPVNRPTRKLTAKEKLDLFITGNVPPDAEPENSMQALPFFRYGSELPANLMRSYLANAESIHAFPRLTLKPGESAIMMFRLKSLNPAPGSYQASLSARTSDGVTAKLPVNIQVVNLTLPEVPLWIRAWGPLTTVFPFETSSRIDNDVKFMRELGANIMYGFPEPGSKMELFRKTGKTFFRVRALPRGYSQKAIKGELTPDTISAEQKQEITTHIKELVKQARSFQIPYDEWFVELWDEPGEKNAAIFGALCKIIKAVDPKVNIYMNPCFWRPGFPPQQVIVDHLKPYYNDMIDISCPIRNLVRDNLTTRELWTKPRLVNASYLHPARRAGRHISYHSFRYGMNGWGYYCYFAPRGNPWDIMTWKHLSYAYQMVFPTHSGVVITPIYETMREGIEDYKLLTALKQQGKTALLQELLSVQGKKNPDYKALRDKALKTFAK